jgi:hypothetical protein
MRYFLVRLAFERIPSRFFAQRALVEICPRTSVSHARINAHVVNNCSDTSDFSHTTLDLIEGENAAVRIAVQNIPAYIGVGVF